jgi:hypothetical protein
MHNPSSTSSLAQRLSLIEEVHTALVAIMGRSFVAGAPDTFAPFFAVLDKLETSIRSEVADAQTLESRCELLGYCRQAIRQVQSRSPKWNPGTSKGDPYGVVLNSLRHLQYLLTGDDTYL